EPARTFWNERSAVFVGLARPTATYQVVSSAAAAVVERLRPWISSAAGSTVTVTVVLVKPGAEMVRTAVPEAPSTPWMTKPKLTVPLAIGRSIEPAPAVVSLGETRTTDGALLATVTLTPPCCGAPSVALVESCRPAPTATGAGPEMPGVVTVTVRLP